MESYKLEVKKNTTRSNKHAIAVVISYNNSENIANIIALLEYSEVPTFSE